MRFSYRKLLLPRHSPYFGASVLKPIIPIKISVGDKELYYSALVDSGADFCIFDAEVGEYLGSDIKAGQRVEFSGIEDHGGSVAFLHDISLDIGGWSYKTKIGFSYDISRRGFGVLGQRGFFDIFIVKFDLAKEEIELRGRK